MGSMHAQEVHTLAQDLIQLIRDDHAEFRDLLARMETASPDERRELFQTLVGELARHEASEESLVHSTLRDEAPGGQGVAEQVLAEESEAESLLARMEKMDATSPEFMEAFATLRDDVLAHAEHEEREEHPRLRETLSEARLQELAEAWTTLKGRAPTRPHPHTPQTPEVRAAVGPVAAVFDRARDAARELFSR